MNRSKSGVIFLFVLIAVVSLAWPSDNIHEAIIKGDLDAVQAILETDKSPLEARNSDSLTPLLLASVRGQTEIAHFLIEKGVNIHAGDSDNSTALHNAAARGHSAVLSLLIDNGARINQCDGNGMTALHFAVSYGHPECAKFLLEKYSNVNAREPDARNNHDRTPLDYAIMTGHSEAANFLRVKGANPGAKKIEFMGGQKIPSTIGEGEVKPIQMTVLYDNYVAAEGTKAEWGFSCLIQGTEKTVLFDTGGNPDIFRHNVEHLSVDLNTVDAVVLSHDHWDHIGALPVVFETNTKAPIYIPSGFPLDFIRKVEVAGARPVPVNEAVAVCDHVYLTGQMGTDIKEQSLIVNTPAGLVIVTGCAHQGIVNIIKKAKELLNRDVYLVFGGFHLMEHSEEQVEAIIKDFKELGVKKCGATHCTGDCAIQQFKDAYGDDYVEIGTGRVLRFGKTGLQ